MLVHILDHYDGTIDHRPDRNRDAAQRHDVGVHALRPHNDECRENTDRETDNRDQRRTHMKQKNDAHQGDYGKLQQQFIAEVFHRPPDQGRAVVHGDDLHALRQALLQLLEPGLDAINSALGVLAETHHHDAADGLALAIELGNAPAHLRAQIDLGHVPEAQRRAVFIDAQRDVGQVLFALNVAGGPHHVFGLGHLHHRGPHFLIGAFDGHLNMGQRHAEGAQLFRIHRDLILLDHAAHGRHFRHARHGLQFILQIPVLDRAQLANIVLARAVDQGIEIDPADAARIRPQLRRGGSGQADLA